MEQMGKYQLVRRIATGGMAEVFLAKAAGPMGFEKELVVKRILPHLAEDPHFVEMFLTEAKLAARLNHGNVVQIFDFGEQGDAYFIAMEYVEGLNLKNLARRAFQQGKPISYPLIARIVSLACEGLAYAHELLDPESKQPMGFIHRDISTDNILVSMTGGVKVVDFGIAKAANVGQQTTSGVLKGKLAYMPPEYLTGTPIDSRADIYALGVVLYELIAGRKPFMAATDILLAQLIVHSPPADVRTLRADVPAPLVQVIERAMNKDRQARYASCREMQADLERFLLQNGELVSALQIADLVKALSAAPEPPPRRISGEIPLEPPRATAPATQLTRSLRSPTQPPAVQHVEEDTIVTPLFANPQGAIDDEELLRLAMRPRRHWPVGIAAGLLLLGGGAFLLSQEKDSHPPDATASNSESQKALPTGASPDPASAVPAPAPSPSVAPTQEPKAASPSPPVALKHDAKVSENSSTQEDLDSDSTSAGTTQLQVTCNHAAKVWVNDHSVGFISSKAKPWKHALSPGSKRVEVNGIIDGFRFNKVKTVQLEEGHAALADLSIQRVKVQVLGQRADLKVLDLDGHALDSSGWIETYEGWHTLKVVQVPSGKNYLAECLAKVGDKICRVVLNPQ